MPLKALILERLLGAADDAAHRPQRFRRREKVARQLERPLDQMDDHDSNDTAGRPSKEGYGR